MFKKIIKMISTIFLVSMFSLTIYGADYTISDYKINAEVDDKGNMYITEYLKYYFDESMNGLKRSLLYKYTNNNNLDNMNATSTRYQASNIENIRAYISDSSFENMNEAILKEESLLSNGQNGFYSIMDAINNGYRKDIKVYSPVSENSYKYVKYEYVIRNVAVSYNDYAEIYWNYIGGDWECNIDNFELTLRLPKSVDILAYPHSYANITDCNIVDNVITLKAKDINSYTAVDLRAVYPVESKYLKNYEYNYDFDNLQVIENKMIKDKEKYHLSNKMFGYIAIIGILSTIILFIKAKKSVSPLQKKYSNVEHNPNYLEGMELGEYKAILNNGTGYMSPELIIATLLDLSNRKYIKLDARKKANKKSDDYEYYVSLIKEKDYSTLSNYEINLINYIFNKKIQDKIDIDDSLYEEFELNKRFKSLSTEYKLSEGFRKVCTKLDSKNKYYDGISSKVLSLFLFTIMFLIVALIVNIFYINPLNYKDDMIGISVVLGVIWTIFTFIGIAVIGTRVKEEYIDTYNKLLGLKKYLNEYSLIKERYPIEIVLWEKYLIFASLFGIAEKVSKEFKEELLAKGYDEEYIASNYGIMMMATHSNSFVASASSSVYSSSSSSSGGYSGSGSGGGGGRRWRRRSLLKLS